jgi:diacylglycerol kinase family enzyme
VRRLAVFVVNPVRVRDMARLRSRCAAAAAAAGWAPPLLLTTARDDTGAGATRRALEVGAAVVAAVGGDGTVRACAQTLAGSDVPLAIVPAGSANLTAAALGIPAGRDAALHVAFAGRDRRIDLATANGQLFTAMAGMGVDAAVVGATTDRLKWLAGWPAYAAVAIGQLLHRPATFTIRLDGGPPIVRAGRSVAVGNSGALPGGFPIMPAARLDDGLLDIAILAPAGLLGWVAIGCRVVARSHRDDRHLERYRARRVEIRADLELPRQVDGEIIRPGRALTVTVLPGALLVRS